MSEKQKKELKKIITALILFFILVILEHIPALSFITKRRLLMFILYLVPYFIAGYPVLRKAFFGIKNLQPFDESFLMTIATIGAFVTGENSEACAVMLFYQIGEFFQSYAVRRSRRSIKDLMDIAPESAFIEREDGTVEETDPDEVEIGDIVVVKPGEKVPVDGTVVSGTSMLNTAALTGESVPRSVRPGDQIISGCINGDGLIRYKAEKKYEDSTVSRILEMVEDASEKKSKTENFITRFAKYYTPVVVIAAVVMAVIPPIFVGGWMKHIYTACTFLVISCPCAIVISVPLSFFGGIGAASREGVLVKGSNYLELLSNLDTVVTDKTGTLTKGEFKVQKVFPAGNISEKYLLEKAAAAESMSTHPIALSIKEAAEKAGIRPEALTADDIENRTGKGIIAESGSTRIYAGNSRLMEEEGIKYVPCNEPGSTVVYVAREDMAEGTSGEAPGNEVSAGAAGAGEAFGKGETSATAKATDKAGKDTFRLHKKAPVYLGTIVISDTEKPEAREAIELMKKRGVKKVVMLTGDLESTAEKVGKDLGIDCVYSELMPQDKVEKVEELIKDTQARGGKLAFIGDGINDAPVLSRSDVGIAMGSMGSDAAIEAADVVIMDDNLMHIPRVIKIAAKTVFIAKQNITFALAVKAVILFMGIIGRANMWAAVFADVGVAVLCILNSMRMLKKE